VETTAAKNLNITDSDETSEMTRHNGPIGGKISNQGTILALDVNPVLPAFKVEENDGTK
jgi:hypothetical protein